MTRGRVAFVVLGCAKNQVEAETLTALLAREGWNLTADIPSADLVVVHSCGFLEEARAEARETLAQVRRAAPRSFLVLTGCYAQFLNRKKIAGVNAVLGTGQLGQLPEILNGKKETVAVSSPEGWHDAETPRPLHEGQRSAYLRISEGCDHRCSFCIIPQLRGGLKSRSVDDILRETRGLVDRGIAELNVISQDTTAYGMDQGSRSLPQLLKKILALPGLEWVRLLYAYPSEVEDRLIHLLADEPKLCGYLDMPLQHISDPILKAMKRDSGEKDTRRLIERLHRAVPHLALRTTFIVGFPGEREEDFQRLVECVKEGPFEHVGVFPYSFESRSPSAHLPGSVSPEVVQERWQRLLDAHRTVKEKRDRGRIGKTGRVLAQLAPTGRWDVRSTRQAPEVDGEILLDRPPPAPGFYQARWTGVDGINLKGKLVKNGTV